MSTIFGPVAQLGYVVTDLDKAMQRWISVGVGPFLVPEGIQMSGYSHRGTDYGDVEFKVALANSGDLQIELIEPVGDYPSMWREYIEAHGETGLQHLGYWTEDFDAILEKAVAAGHRVVMSAQASGGRWAYFESPANDGTIVELSEQSAQKKAAFDAIRDAAASWDGTTDPIRRIPANA
ncbi:MAG TPA: VOC family protein [Aldersonia sp.]